jgi:bifunctional UDP-N-acetylglucosamine pyrophosphorylase/glucosamine-1-phosphate N-acetyltransferase
MSLNIVILAAGQGKRMHSPLPKVLHCLAGEPLLAHVAHSALALSPVTPPIIIYGHQGATVRQTLAKLPVFWVEQKEQQGTGHALSQALPYLAPENRVLILYGDVPLISPLTLQTFLTNTPDEAVGIITAHLPNPHGLGRILRDAQNNILRVIEEKDATPAELLLKEINSGIYLIPARYLQKWLPLLNNHNAQQEFYLTDIIALAAQANIPLYSQAPAYDEEVLGVNDCIQLAQLERFYQRGYAEKLMRQGITLLDPNRFDIRGELVAGTNVVIDINVIIEGKVILGNHCIIGPNTILRDVTLGDHVEVKANSMVEGAQIAAHCTIGPFARIRPGTQVAPHVQIGNFIEIKNSLIGSHSKIHHVGYIGDSELGKQVNIGAGTITCNYDGVHKHKTIIGDNAFIGSNTELVAPVIIGENAFIGAGSTITRNAPAHQLTLCRGRQRSIENWRLRKKQSQEI